MRAEELPDPRWVAYVVGEDRTGTLAAMASVFSSRGVCFDAVATHDAHDGAGLVTVVFRSSDRVRHVLARTLARLAVTRSVVVRAAEDPAVRAVGVVHATGPAAPTPPAGAAVVWSGDAAAGQPLLVSGPLTEVEKVLGAARASGAQVASVLLPLEGA
jgi:hypothetical protein